MKRKDQLRDAMRRTGLQFSGEPALRFGAGLKIWALTFSDFRERMEDSRCQAFIDGTGPLSSAGEVVEQLMRGPDDSVLQRYDMIVAGLSERGVETTASIEDILSSYSHDCSELPRVYNFVKDGRGDLDKALKQLLLSEAKQILAREGLSSKLARPSSASAKRLTSPTLPVNINEWVQELHVERAARRTELEEEMLSNAIEHSIDLSFSKLSLYADVDGEVGYADGGYYENYTDYAEEADQARNAFVEQGIGKSRKVIQKMLKVKRLRELLLAIQQLPGSTADLPMHLDEWAQSRNEECITFIETGKTPKTVTGVVELAARLADRNFPVDYSDDHDDYYSKYDDPMQEYYDEGYGSG